MKTVLLLVSLVLFSSLGEILSARGMKQIGEIPLRPRLFLQTIPRLFTNSSLIFGVICLAVSFFSFLSLLSYADLSYVVPLTAVGYITNTIGSKFLLHEKITPARWWGTVLVTVGVAIISLPAQTDVFLGRFLRQLAIWLQVNPEYWTPLSIGLFSFRLLFLCFVLAAIVYYVLAICAGIDWTRDRRRQRALVGLNFTPSVSILIPVRGADADAYQNFVTFCHQDYPAYEIIFGCRDEQDAALPVLRQIQTDFPHQSIRIVVSPHEIGHNAKVSNLQNMYAHAAHDYLVIVDSDIRVTADYLRRVMAPLQNSKVGMVTCLYRGAAAQTVASLLENIGISSNFGPEVMTSRFLEGIKFALGSTIVTRRAVLEQIGGFPAVADFLADDFWLGNRTAAAGYQVVLSDYIVDHIAARDTFSTMFKHQLRWGRSVRVSRPKGFAGLILTYGLATSVLLLVLLNFSFFGWALVFLTYSIRLVTAIFGGVILMKDWMLLKFCWLIPVRDWLGFVVWLLSLSGNTVEWRGARFIVERNGKMTPLQS